MIVHRNPVVDHISMTLVFNNILISWSGYVKNAVEIVIQVTKIGSVLSPDFIIVKVFSHSLLHQMRHMAGIRTLLVDILPHIETREGLVGYDITCISSRYTGVSKYEQAISMVARITYFRLSRICWYIQVAGNNSW